MFEFIQKLMDEILEEFHGTATTPAASHLFETDDEGGKLNKATADLYHHLVAMLLYLAKRERPDLQTEVSFLCTRVRQPDEYN